MRGKHLFPLLSLLLAVPFAMAAQRPNVILILMDDMGWGDLPSYQDQRMKEGFPAMDNPGLRMLAREGMTLTRHYSSAPLCAPARASLFTGVHQGHVKVIRDRSFDLPIEQAPTLGTVMQAAGYKTAEQRASMFRRHTAGADSCSSIVSTARPCASDSRKRCGSGRRRKRCVRAAFDCRGTGFCDILNDHMTLCVRIGLSRA